MCFKDLRVACAREVIFGRWIALSLLLLKTVAPGCVTKTKSFENVSFGKRIIAFSL